MNEKIHICQSRDGKIFYAVLTCGYGTTVDTSVDVDSEKVILNNDFLAKKMFKVAFRSKDIISFASFLVSLRDRYRLYHHGKLTYTTLGKEGCTQYSGLNGTDERISVYNLSAETLCHLLNQVDKYTFDFNEIWRLVIKRSHMTSFLL